MRDMASLSGSILKLPIVWWMSWGAFVSIPSISISVWKIYRSWIFVEKHSETPKIFLAVSTNLFSYLSDLTVEVGNDM